MKKHIEKWICPLIRYLLKWASNPSSHCTTDDQRLRMINIPQHNRVFLEITDKEPHRSEYDLTIYSIEF